MGAANGLRPCLADAERTHLALRDELRHGAERLFHRHTRVDPVLVIKIDHVDAEPLEAFLAGADHIVRPALGDLALAAAEIAEFGRQHHLAAPALDGLADQLFQLFVLLRFLRFLGFVLVLAFVLVAFPVGEG